MSSITTTKSSSQFYKIILTDRQRELREHDEPNCLFVRPNKSALIRKDWQKKDSQWKNARDIAMTLINAATDRWYLGTIHCAKL